VRQTLATGLLYALLCAPAAAEIYRCTDAQGHSRFVDDASTCPNATKYTPTREIVVSPPARRAERRATLGAALESLLPDATRVGPGWEITLETPITQLDAEQQDWGIVETHARHYGRVRDGVTEVCTIDLWRFSEAAKATAAAKGLRYPGWNFEAHGSLLVTLRGTRWKRDEAFRGGLFPACFELGALVLGP